MIGGDVCHEKGAPRLPVRDGQVLSHGGREVLWRGFVADGDNSQNDRH